MRPRNLAWLRAVAGADPGRRIGRPFAHGSGLVKYMLPAMHPRARARFAPIRAIVWWSLLWGLALGWLVLAPAVVSSHRLTVVSLGEWGALVLVLSGVFSATGVVAGIVGGSLLVIVRNRRGEFASPGWAWCLGTPPSLLLGYVALSFALRYAGLGAFRSEGAGAVGLAAAASVPVAAAVLAWLVYRRLRHQGGRHRTAPLAWGLVMLALVGTAATPLRVPRPVPRQTSVSPGRGAVVAGEPQAALLMVGIDSLTPRVLDAAQATVGVRWFQGLADYGHAAVTKALWPPYWSSPAWAAILTGSPVAESGLSNDLFVEAPGLPAYTLPFDGPILIGPVVALELVLARARVVQPVPPSGSVLRRPPIWRRLTDAGVTTAVVRFPFSHPASGQASYTISSRTGRDEFWELGVRSNSGADLVSPPELNAYVDRFFGDASPVPATVFEEVLPDDVMRHASRNLLTDERELIALGLDIDARTLAAARQLLADYPDIRAMFVYLGGFDTACHHLWRYRFPEDYPDRPGPSPEERAVGRTLDRYLAFLDRELADLSDRLAVDPTVIVLSDHGHEATTRHPLFSGWHSPDAVLMVGGGRVVPSRRTRWRAASYEDVIPTVLDVFGLPADASGSGRSWLQDVADRRPPP